MPALDENYKRVLTQCEVCHLVRDVTGIQVAVAHAEGWRWDGEGAGSRCPKCVTPTAPASPHAPSFPKAKAPAPESEARKVRRLVVQSMIGVLAGNHSHEEALCRIKAAKILVEQYDLR